MKLRVEASAVAFQKLEVDELVGFALAAPLVREHTLYVLRQGCFQGLVIDRLGAGSRMLAASDGVPAMATGGGHAEVAFRFTPQLTPRPVMALLTICKSLEDRCELLPFTRQSRESRDPRWVYEPALVTKRAPVVHAGANHLPKNVGGCHGRVRLHQQIHGKPQKRATLRALSNRASVADERARSGHELRRPEKPIHFTRHLLGRLAGQRVTRTAHDPELRVG
jgi:hypothetical protein